MKAGEIIKKCTAHFKITGVKKEDLLPVYEKLHTLGYSEQNVFKRLDVDDIDRIMIKYLPVYLAFRMTQNDFLDRLIKLFILARDVPKKEVEEIFSEAELEILIKVGVLEEKENYIRSFVDIFPCMGGFFATDHMVSEHFFTRHVYPLGGDSYTLARGMINDPVDSTLDFCTGSGVQGILASKFSKKVVCVDINPRAANFVQFNALLNQSDNVEVRLGNLFEVVKEDEKFDLILANPPFVPSPEQKLLFRDGSSSGESVLEKIVEGLPKHLKEGGRSQIVTLLVFTEEKYIDKLKRWLSDTPFHIFIIAHRYIDIEPYISNHMELYTDFEDYSKNITRWMKCYLDEGIVKLADGLITIKRASKSSPATELRQFRNSADRYSDKIKTAITTMENFNDLKLYNALLEKEFYIPDEVNFYWESKTPAAKLAYGVLFDENSFYLDEQISRNEKCILDIITSGIKTGKDIRDKFIPHDPTEDKEEIFKLSMMNLMRIEIIKVK